MMKKRITVLTAVILGGLSLFVYVTHGKAVFKLDGLRRWPAALARQRDGFYSVTRVIDGDTVEITGGIKVRLIGIDTPESKPNERAYSYARKNKRDIETVLEMGRAAAGFTSGLVEGRRVRLEYDAERRDAYGRTLAYVRLEDGTFVNAEIIKEGYAGLLTIPPNVKYADMFRRLYAEARENKRGLWKE